MTTKNAAVALAIAVGVGILAAPAAAERPISGDEQAATMRVTAAALSACKSQGFSSTNPEILETTPNALMLLDGCQDVSGIRTAKRSIRIVVNGLWKTLTRYRYDLNYRMVRKWQCDNGDSWEERDEAIQPKLWFSNHEGFIPPIPRIVPKPLATAAKKDKTRKCVRIKPKTKSGCKPRPVWSGFRFTVQCIAVAARIRES